MITYRSTHDIDLPELAALFRSAGWAWRASDPVKLAALVSGSLFVEGAWDEAGPGLVGFARAISDGVSNAYVSTVAVLPDYRGRGIGTELLRRLLSGRGAIRFLLHAEPGVK